MPTTVSHRLTRLVSRPGIAVKLMIRSPQFYSNRRVHDVTQEVCRRTFERGAQAA